MARVMDGLARRRRRCKAASFSACCSRSWAFVVFNLVLLALFLLDGPVAAYIRVHRLEVRPVGSVITDFGQSGWILAASLLICAEAYLAYRLSPSCRRRFQAAFVGHMALYVFLCVALSGVTANLLKRVIGRARPVLYDQLGMLSLNFFAGSSRFESFPSGHATTIGAFMMAMALLAPPFRLVFLVMGLWLGFSRVIVGAHYPSDVIAGLALGAWFSLVIAILFSRHRLLFRQTGEGWPLLRRPVPLSLLPPSITYPKPAFRLYGSSSASIRT
ncbi:phosphatase PAP2 family protein [Neorhizobium lilium]|nr:phosphatase PAP2 family protein [Neorhizobium lilium]